MIESHEEYVRKMDELSLLMASVSEAGGFLVLSADLISQLNELSSEIEEWEAVHYPIPMEFPDEEGG